MRIRAVMPEACNRTRQHVSLRLDAQLSELEVAVMQHHLARCPACRTFADDVDGVTEALREAELVEPPIRFELPHKPARVGVSRAGATAAAGILVAVALGGVAGLGPDGPDRSLANTQALQDQRALQEHLTLVHRESSAPALEPPQGVAAAEETTVDRSPGTSPAGEVGSTAPSGNGG